MKHIRDLVGRELKWIQPHTLKREYDLQSAGDVVATLRFRSAFGSLATGESADGAWTFKRVGFFANRVNVRVRDTETDIAIFKNNTWTNGGTLQFPDGHEVLANTNFWATEYSLQTPSQSPLVTYRRIGGLLHLSSTVEIAHAAAALPELPWLVMLGWYLTVNLHVDAAMIGAS